MARLSSLALPLLTLALVLLFPTFSEGTSCNQTSLTILTPCLPYVESGNTTKPGSDCCNPLATLVGTEPTCLCQLAPLASQLGVAINESRALEIAQLCKLTIPASVESCLASLAPSPAPFGSITSPSPTAGVTPPGTPAGAHSGAKIAHSTSLFAAGILAALICAMLSQ